MHLWMEEARRVYNELPETIGCWSIVANDPENVQSWCHVCGQTSRVLLKHYGQLGRSIEGYHYIWPNHCKTCVLHTNHDTSNFCEPCGIDQLDKLQHYDYEYKVPTVGRAPVIIVKKCPPWRRAKRANFQ